MNTSRRRSRIRLLVPLLAAALVAAGCGGDGDTDEGASASASASAVADAPTAEQTTSSVEPSEATEEPAGDSAFPVTITHALGETTIDAEPLRIISLSGPEGDALVALGITPVGVPGTPTAPGALPTWWGDRIDPADTTLLISDFSGVFNLEEIAALEPDLILGAGSVLDAAAYEQYSSIAPTIPYLTEAFQDPWRDVTLMVGAAVGMPDEAAVLVADTEAAIDGLATIGLDGATYTFNVVPAPGTVISVTEPADVANQLLGELGMSIAPGVADLPRQPTTGSMISPEQLNLIDADVVMYIAVTEQAADGLLAEPTFAATPAATEGRLIRLDLDEAVALRAPGVLAIPWLFDQLEPERAAILG
ncbi:MAG: ABC transporter substrate-binding protein [Actinomycetota bacterium]